MCNKNQALEILKAVYEQSASVYADSICDTYLYGSYARGDFTDESDVDILLTVNEDNKFISGQRKKMAEISSDLSLKYDITVSITVKPKSQFTEYKNVLPFYKNVIREGIRYAVWRA